METVCELQWLKEKHRKRGGDTCPTHELGNLLTSGGKSWASSAPDPSHPLCLAKSSQWAHRYSKDNQWGSHPEYKSPLTGPLTIGMGWQCALQFVLPAPRSRKLNSWICSVHLSMVSGSPLQSWRVWHLGRGQPAQMEDSEEHVDPGAWD